MTKVRITSGYMNVQEVKPGTPEHPIAPGGGGPVDPGYGYPDRPVDPDYGISVERPTHPIEIPGLPEGPEQPLPLPPEYPDNSLPPIEGHPSIPPPVIPNFPLYPVPPDVEPPPAGAVFPPLPPVAMPKEGSVAIMVVNVGVWGERYIAVDPNATWPQPPKQPKG